MAKGHIYNSAPLLRFPALTHPFLRQMVRLPPLPAHFTIEVAESKQDLEGAFRLLHNVYVEIGFMETHPSGMRLNVYNMLPHTTTIVAKVEGKIVGTVTMVRENPLGLPLSESIDTTFYRKPGWQIAEVTSLAVAPEWRGQGQILFPLLKYVYEYATHYAKVDVLQIASALSKEDFFRAILFFEPISDKSFRDPLINATQVSALYLDLHHAKIQFKRAYDQKPDKSNLFSYFTSLNLPGFRYPESNNSQTLNPVWTLELFKYFFNEKSNLLERLSDREIHVLHSIYQDTLVSSLLPKANSLPPYPPRRVATRYSVNLNALIESDIGDEHVTLMDVSEGGFRLFTKLPMRPDGVCHFRIQVSSSQSIPLTARPVWNRRRREWGFAILNAPLGWKQFIQSLASQAA